MRNRILVTALALLAAGAGAAAAATALGATATLSSVRPGARDVVLTVHIRSVLECGRLQAASVQVRLPREMHVPRRIARAAVRVSGEPPASVRVAGTVVTLGLAHAGITCFTMGPGTVAIRFGRAAGLRNPLRKGSFDFTVVTGLRVLLGTLIVR
jgi:hypothetical protein